MAMRNREDEVVFPNAAGIDIGASSHWVAVPRHTADDPVREFGAMTADLNALADWLMACGVDAVALESTGVYWIPLYEVLDRRGLTVWLVDARQMKYVPGRKSDVQDCQWLQKLMSLGLLRAAWRPGDDVCVVRAVVRQREVLLTEQGSWVQRMQKALVQMNIQLTEVLTDVMGATGQAIIRDIVAGQRDPALLAQHRNVRVKASAAQVQRALTGNWREEHVFVLTQALAMYDSLAQRVSECDAKLQALLVALQRHEVTLKRAGQAQRQERAWVRSAHGAGALGRCGPHAHQRTGDHLGADGVVGNRDGLEPLCQRQALLLLAGAVPGHQDQRRKSSLGAHPALLQPRAPGAEAGGHEPVAQRLGAGCVLSAHVRAHGQAQSQYGRRAQARANDLLHAHARRKLRRSRSAALRRAAARTLHRRAQAPRRRPWILDFTATCDCVNTGITLLVSQEAYAGCWLPVD